MWKEVFFKYTFRNVPDRKEHKCHREHNHNKAVVVS